MCLFNPVNTLSFSCFCLLKFFLSVLLAFVAEFFRISVPWFVVGAGKIRFSFEAALLSVEKLCSKVQIDHWRDIDMMWRMQGYSFMVKVNKF